MPTLRRAATTATMLTALAATLTGTTPAAAQPSDRCPYAESTRLFTANNETNKVWVYQPADDTLYICFKTEVIPPFQELSGLIVFRVPSAEGLVDSVAVDTDDQECYERLDITDPVEIGLLRLHATTDPLMICVGGAVGPAIRVMVSPPGGTPTATAPEVWIDRNSRLGFYYCTQINPEHCQNSSYEEGNRLL